MMGQRTKFLNSSEVNNVLNEISQKYPSLANNLAVLYNIIDSVSSEFILSIAYEEMMYEVRIKGIEPIVKSDDKGSVLGANIFVGVSNDHISSLIHAGQVMMLLSTNGGIEYETYLYKSLDSAIIGDMDLDQLAKWLRITTHKIKKAVNEKLMKGDNRVISRKRSQQQPSQPMHQTTRHQNQHQKTPMNAKNIPKPQQVSRPISNPQPQPTKIPRPNNVPNTRGKVNEEVEDELEGLIDNIPPFKIKKNHGKVNIPSDLKLTKKK